MLLWDTASWCHLLCTIPSMTLKPLPGEARTPGSLIFGEEFLKPGGKGGTFPRNVVFSLAGNVQSFAFYLKKK